MKPVQQTTFAPRVEGASTGNCLAAAIASVLDLPLDAVPNFAAIEGDAWWENLQRWLSDRGLGCVCVSLNAPSLDQGGWAWTLADGQWVLLNGKSPRGDWKHVVVGEVVLDGDGTASLQYRHDPHPDGSFLDGEATDVWLFTVADPARVLAGGQG
jgi:hypothetical protein